MDRSVLDSEIPFERSEVLSENRYKPLMDIAEGGETLLEESHTDNSQWTKVTNDKKRQRTSTGSYSGGNDVFQKINIHDYKQLPVDEKLSVMFSEIGNIDHKVDQCLSIHNKVNRLEKLMDENTARLTLLEYKSIDLEARSRRKNLIFGGIAESKKRTVSIPYPHF